MKRFFVLAIFLLFASFGFSLDVNIILKNGTLIKGTLIGKTQTELYIEKKGKAKTIPFSKIKQVFKASTGEKIDLSESESANPLNKTAPVQIHSVKPQIIQPEPLGQAFSVVKPHPVWYQRTVKRYFMAEMILGDSFSFSTFSVSMFVGAGAWFRPFDFLAVGGEADIDIFSVYNDEDSMPVGTYAIGVRIIPYSTAKDEKNRSIDYFLEYKYGVASLGGIFNGATIANVEQTGKGNFSEIAIGYGDKSVVFSLAYRILAIRQRDLSAFMLYINYPIY